MGTLLQYHPHQIELNLRQRLERSIYLSLDLCIGIEEKYVQENKMYFNDKEIILDVPAKINDGRTLVALRAISEAFKCEVS